MEFLFYILIIIIVIFVIISQAGGEREKYLKLERQYKKDVLDKISKLNNFQPEKTILKCSHKGLKRKYSKPKPLFPKGVSFDFNGNNVVLISHGEIFLVQKNELIEAEVIIDGETVTKTSRGSQIVGAVVGGALAGAPGLIVGGLSGKKTTTKSINQVYLKILTKNKEISVLKIDFIEATRSGQTSPQYARQQANSTLDSLKILMAEK